MVPYKKFAQKVKYCNKNAFDKSKLKVDVSEFEEGKIDFLLKTLKKDGILVTKRKFSYYKDCGIWSLRIDDLRIYGFFMKNDFYISHCVRKKWVSFRDADKRKVLTCKKRLEK